MLTAYVVNANAEGCGDFVVPAKLVEALEKARLDGFDEVALAVLSSFIRASLVPRNVTALDSILTSMEDVLGTDVQVYKAWFGDGKALPTLRVRALRWRCPKK